MNVRVCAGIGVQLLTCTHRKLVKATDRPRPIEKVRNAAWGGSGLEAEEVDNETPGIETDSLSGSQSTLWQFILFITNTMVKVCMLHGYACLTCL